MRIRKNLANIQMSQNKQIGKRRKEMSEDAVDINNEENEYIMANSTICNGIMRYYREQRPASYMLKIKSYSTLAVSKLERYESDEFVAGDHKWRMIAFLRGNNEVNRDRHISLYLAIVEEEDLPNDWELMVEFKFFVHDQINDKYLVIQDLERPLKRFHATKTECGFGELLSMDAFKDGSNGFLVDDYCTFGVEVFVVQFSGNWGLVSSIKDPSNGIYTWKISNFLQKAKEICESQSFTVGGTKWKLGIPTMSSGSEFLSIYLGLSVDSMLSTKKWYAEFTLRVKNQKSPLKNKTMNGAQWFSGSGRNGWGGIREFMLLKEFKDETKGYYLNDSVIVECLITNLCEAEHIIKEN